MALDKEQMSEELLQQMFVIHYRSATVITLYIVATNSETCTISCIDTKKFLLWKKREV